MSPKPASRHQPAKSLPVKSKASPKVSNMVSDIVSPNTLSRRASSMRCSTTMNAPPSGRAFVSRADELFFPVEIPVVKNVGHGDDVGFRERLGEEVARGDADPLAQPGRRNGALGDRRHHRLVVARAAQM